MRGRDLRLGLVVLSAVLAVLWVLPAGGLSAPRRVRGRDHGHRVVRRDHRRGLVARVRPRIVAMVPPCVVSGRAVSCSYFYTGSEQTFAVPAGVGAVSVHAVGAPGGNGFLVGGAGGLGASVYATVPLAGGTSTLYVEVGGPGQ